MIPQSTLQPGDKERLESQCERIMAHADGVWRNLREWSAITGGSEAGTSARLRELANEHGYIKEARCEGRGLWLYRILPPPSKSPVQLQLL